MIVIKTLNIHKIYRKRATIYNFWTIWQTSIPITKPQTVFFAVVAEGNLFLFVPKASTTFFNLKTFLVTWLAVSSNIF